MFGGKTFAQKTLESAGEELPYVERKLAAALARIEALEAERDAAMSLAAATKERCDHAEALWRAALNPESR